MAFAEIRNQSDLARHLGCTASALSELKRSNVTHYEPLYLIKRHSVGFRVVFKPSTANVADINKRLLELIQSAGVVFPDSVQGFVKRRSIKTNAEKHLGARVVFNVDIKHFFDSITSEQVTEAFVNLGCNRRIASCLAAITCINGRLAQGLHTSPVLSNMVMRDSDGALQSLAEVHSCAYTRYVDDITFSSHVRVPSLDEVSAILAQHGFELNRRKTRLQYRGHAQYVTGLSVSDPTQARIPKRYKRLLRLEIHYADLYGEDSHLERFDYSGHGPYSYNVSGRITYINGIEPAAASRLSTGG